MKKLKEFLRKNKMLAIIVGVGVLLMVASSFIPQKISSVQMFATDEHKRIKIDELVLTPHLHDPKFSKEYYAKKPFVLVEFFTFYCPNCTKSIPELKKINESDDVNVIAYIKESESVKVKEYKDKHSIDYLIAKPTNKYFKEFNPVAVPMSFLVDSETLEVKASFIGKMTYEKVMRRVEVLK